MALSVFAGASISFALGACGKGPDLASGSSVQIVNVTGPSQTCYGCSYVTSLAFGASGIYAAFVQINSGGNDTGQPKLASIDFPAASVTYGSWPPASAQSTSFLPDGFELATNGDGTLYWAILTNQPFVPDGGTGGGGPQNLVTLYSSTEQSFTSPPTTSGFTLPSIVSSKGSSNPFVMGLAVDAASVFVAYADTASGQSPNNNQTPDTPNYPSGTPVSQRYTGAVARIDRASNAVQMAQGFTMIPAYAIHVLAQNKDTVFWPDYGAAPGGTSDPISIVVEPKTSFGAPSPTAFTAIANTTQPTLTLVGIAANDNLVAWTASEPPGSGSVEPGCQVWTRDTAGTVTKIYDSFASGTSPAISCYGLAVDDRYAYVPVIDETNTNGVSGQVIFGKGMARVPLAGGALQVLPLQSDRWYGPRRVMVDSTFVYAIDPSYVLRFPKSAFSN